MREVSTPLGLWTPTPHQTHWNHINLMDPTNFHPCFSQKPDVFCTGYAGDLLVQKFSIKVLSYDNNGGTVLWRLDLTGLKGCKVSGFNWNWNYWFSYLWYKAGLIVNVNDALHKLCTNRIVFLLQFRWVATLQKDAKRVLSQHFLGSWEHHFSMPSLRQTPWPTTLCESSKKLRRMSMELCRLRHVPFRIGSGTLVPDWSNLSTGGYGDERPSNRGMHWSLLS